MKASDIKKPPQVAQEAPKVDANNSDFLYELLTAYLERDEAGYNEVLNRYTVGLSAEQRAEFDKTLNANIQDILAKLQEYVEEENKKEQLTNALIAQQEQIAEEYYQEQARQAAQAQAQQAAAQSQQKPEWYQALMGTGSIWQQLASVPKLLIYGLIVNKCIDKVFPSDGGIMKTALKQQEQQCRTITTGGDNTKLHKTLETIEQRLDCIQNPNNMFGKRQGPISR